jgi:K+-transporting ATPase ATPase C chain
MRNTLISSVIAVVVLTIVLGLAYPLAVTGIGQVAFPGRADGSLIHRDGKVVGSTLLAQRFGGAKWFHPRPSQTGYDPSSTFFSNNGPNQKATEDLLAAQAAKYRRVEGTDEVPVDAATTSGSGVDPHISRANAEIQAERVARVRALPLDRVRQLIDDHTDGRFLGLVGEAGVNVTELNLAVDQEAAR